MREQDNMKMIRCRKCGTMVASEDSIIERIMDEVREERKLAIKELKKGNALKKNGKTILGDELIISSKERMKNASQLEKFQRQLMHQQTQLVWRSELKERQFSVLVRYLFDNHLITEEKLNELETIAIKEAENNAKEEERKIDLIYKSYSDYTSNRTKADTTYCQATKK